MSPTETDASKGGEHELINSLGISLSGSGGQLKADDQSAPDLVDTEDAGYEVVPNPSADAVDWTDIPKDAVKSAKALAKADPDSELDALQELLPDVKERRRSNEVDDPDEAATANNNNNNEGKGGDDADISGEVDVDDIISGGEGGVPNGGKRFAKRISMQSGASSTGVQNISAAPPVDMHRVDSMRAQRSKDLDDSVAKPTEGNQTAPDAYQRAAKEEIASSSHEDDESDKYSGLSGNESDAPAPGEGPKEGFVGEEANKDIPKEFYNNMASGQSVSTATQTHEVRMPMYLPTFKPATGCTNASDFIVRCFVARLRSGITVVKHGRSRWCKSRLRVLHIHPDGCSLSWKPAEGEPTSNRRPPKLDLTQCLEVRHAWSPDPQNPMYTGTPILRQKCEAANAHKSFALIFPKRTVDITAVTADQCKVLMEGFSALCFRLQVADLAGKGANKKGGAQQRMPEEDGVSTTASVTLTNSSTPRAR
ncbi:expressed unknown protein [Seminavis robusta]|uniref:Uncharacterized protein n=1 Tax=Seminavis robusta TaxID=568900 RepID=A0A9N8EY47_9STRA|nr:expressed unknown protein [Seminavis robusta]|eukprot:Sro2045_g312450.1 n/a (481) ;mRNA; r:10834-12276